jgi:hypothetical protein
MGKCFVVLRHPSGDPVPICDFDADGEPDITAAVFESFAAAERAMDEHTFAKAWGYEIYPWPADRSRR